MPDQNPSARGSPDDPRRPPSPTSATPGPPYQHAARLAEAVAAAWHRHHGSGDIEVPVSVVAALAFIEPSARQREQAAADLLTLDTARFATLMRTQWAIFIRSRPDLLNRAWPLIRVWHGQPSLDDETVHAAKAVADAAIRAGQLQLTGTDRRQEVDVFGPLLAALRPASAARARGQFYTPPDIAHALTSVRGVPEGEPVIDCFTGTGGLLRAAAQAMRDQGRDPATTTWHAVDNDELAIACLAVNVILWGLGDQVLLGVGNALNDEWIARAKAERDETVEFSSRARDLRRAMDAVSALQRLIHTDEDEQQ
jgi:hypothetical protein